MSPMSKFTCGPAVVIPLVTLLVLSSLANVYLVRLVLMLRQDASGAWTDFGIARKLPSSLEDFTDSQATVDAVQMDLSSSFEWHRPHSLPALFSKPSASPSYPGGMADAWPGVSSLSEEPTLRALSEDSVTESSAIESLATESSASESQASCACDATSSHSSGHGSAHAAACPEHEGEHPHQHDALFFFFNMILLGAGLLHINSLFPGLQFTIMLFVLGMIVSAFLEGANLKCDTGILGKSYIMWMDIDPHLLLFTMLPSLLAGDAMTIDTSVAKRVSLQCLYLAGPGVLVSAMVVAVFLMFYFNWSFLVGLATASILCATDPVAVVALLKELGASPVLTVQIQGESLLNDGTAIVLYTVAYNMLSGEDYDTADIIMFLVKTALMACAVGCFLGYIFFSWLRAANDRFKHAAGVIQILLTFSAAYWSFIMAEGVLHMSGVLATVSSSMVLAHHMWPHVVSKDNLLNFWHCLEELMNIIIFLLAGSLCGAAMVHIEPIDYLHLIVIYCVLTLGRAALIFGSRPLLTYLSFDNMPVSKADAAVMTWGGLRGAVGLALAIQVQRGRAENADGVPQIDDNTARRILFFVSGIAFLTTTINATTCPSLVKILEITTLPHIQEEFLKKFTGQLVQISVAEKHPEEVTYALESMLHHVDAELHEKSERDHGPKIIQKYVRRSSTRQSITGRENICRAFQAARELFKNIPDKEKSRLDHPAWSDSDLEADTEELIKTVSGNIVDEEMCKVVNKTFMSMVSHNYQSQIIQGELRPGSPEADLLFTSIRFCLSPLGIDLTDFDFIHHAVTDDELEGNMGNVTEEATLSNDLRVSYRSHGVSEYLPKTNSMDDGKPKHPTDEHRGFFSAAMHGHFKHIPHLDRRGCHALVDMIVRSSTFAMACVGTIVFNGVCVVIDELARNDSNMNHPIWLVMELFFSILFTCEAALKIVHSPRGYFKDAWNKFDFFLVLVGIVGGVMSTAEFVSQESASGAGALGEASRASRIIRIARVLRTMRLLRMFQLFHAMLSSDKLVSQKLAASMLKTQSLTSFVQAHITSQKQMKRFFVGKCGKGEKFSDVEIARCILQSLVSVHKALFAIVAVQQNMDEELLDDLLHKKETKRITEALEEFVVHAEEAGAISSQEAHAILHPMHHTLANCLQFINKLDDGVIHKAGSRESLKSHASHTLGSHELGSQTLKVVATAEDHLVVKDPEFFDPDSPVKEPLCSSIEANTASEANTVQENGDATFRSDKTGSEQGFTTHSAPSRESPEAPLEDEVHIAPVSPNLYFDAQDPQPPDTPDPTQKQPPAPRDKQHILVLEEAESVENTESALLCCARPPRAAPKQTPWLCD